MSSRYWVVVPAAGAGRRMGADTYKQYFSLLGKSVIEWSLLPFLDDPRFAAVVVVLAADDVYWNTLEIAKHPKLRTAKGGSERVDSVRAGVALLADSAQPQDWVLVHDAARPCLDKSDLDALIDVLTQEPDDDGGLLATPLADTLKQADSEQRVATTIPRGGLWRALTPQMFRFEILQRALKNAFNNGLIVTDEAAAVEALGFKPRLISGRADNLKVTVPEDMVLAASILAARS